MSKDLATIRTDLELKIPDIKIEDTIFYSDNVLKDSQDQVTKLELNKYIRKYKSQQETTDVDATDLTINEISSKNFPLNSLLFKFENNIYVVNDEIAGRLVDDVVIDKDFISLTTQKLFTSLPKLDTKYVTAYDCLLFLHDPNKRPDNLLNVCKHIEQANLLNKKSTIEDFIKFFNLNYNQIINDLKNFKSDKTLIKLYEELDFPIVSVLNSMQIKGVKVSNKKIDTLSKIINQEISDYR